MKNVLMVSALIVGLTGFVSQANASMIWPSHGYHSAADANGVRHVLRDGDTKAFAMGSRFDNPEKFGLVRIHDPHQVAFVHKKSSVMKNPESGNLVVNREVGIR